MVRIARRTGLALVPALLSVLVLVPAAWAADADCDTVDDSVDNCVERFNPDQGNLDGDALGDACDEDRDDDGLANDADNCARTPNADQSDADSDGAGDACDDCADSFAEEAVNRRGCSIEQLCPCTGPDADTAWKDHGQYQRCIRRKARAFRRHGFVTREQAQEILEFAASSSCGDLTPTTGDNDGDQVADVDDNCDSDSNPSQLDTDGDTLGDACDTDRDNDGVLNRDDNCPVVANAEGQSADGDGDTVGDACDACAGTGLADVVGRDGCSVDQACPCDADAEGQPWAGHGAYKRCVGDEVFRLKLSRAITGDEAEAIRQAAAASTCGERPLVCE